MPPASHHAASPASATKTLKGKYKAPETIPRGALTGLPRRPLPDRLRFLTPRQVRELVNAEAFAEAIKRPFAAMLTLHWRCDPAFDPAEWGTRTTRFLDKLRRWLDRQDIPPFYAFVHEVGGHYGHHTHLLLHLPHLQAAAYRALKGELEAWVIETENLEAKRIDPRGRPWSPVRVTPNKPGTFGMRTRKMRGGALSYLLKAIDPDDVTYRGHGAEQKAAAMGIKPRRSKPVKAKRYGASRSLGPKARREADWTELRTDEEIFARLKPEKPNGGARR